jgi:hypothetical protein
MTEHVDPILNLRFNHDRKTFLARNSRLSRLCCEAYLHDVHCTIGHVLIQLDVLSKARIPLAIKHLTIDATRADIRTRRQQFGWLAALPMLRWISLHVALEAVEFNAAIASAVVALPSQPILQLLRVSGQKGAIGTITTIQRVLGSLARWTTLQELQLQHMDLRDNLTRVALPPLPPVTHLSLYSVKMESPDAMQCILDGLPELRGLALTEITFPSGMPATRIWALPQDLESLWMSWVYVNGNPGGPSLWFLQGMAALTKLRSLRLRYVDFQGTDPSGQVDWATMLEPVPKTVQHLSVVDLNPNDDAVAEAVLRLPQLRSLHYGYPYFSRPHHAVPVTNACAAKGVTCTLAERGKRAAELAVWVRQYGGA